MTRAVVLLSLVFGVVACASEATSPDVATQRATVAIAVSNNQACAGCLYGPVTFIRGKGEPEEYEIKLRADPRADYVADIDDGGSRGTNASVVLGDIVLLRSGSGGRILRSMKLKDENDLHVKTMGKPGSAITITIRSGAKVIGAEGGTVVAPEDGVTMDIPPGALSSPMELRVHLNSALPSPLMGKAVTPVVDLQPDGLTFAKPITIAVRVPRTTGAKGGVQFYQIIPNSTLLQQVIGSAFDSVTSRVTATLQHFSTYVAVWDTYVPRGLPYTYKVSSTPSIGVGGTTPEDVLGDVRRAISMWLGYTHKIGIDFVAADVACPNVEILWSDDVSAKGETFERPIDLDYGSCSTVLTRVITLNNRLSWRSSDRGPAANGEWNVADVVTHEFGHALGLNHPSANKCEAYLVSQILPPSGDVADCYQPPVMRAKGDNAPVPVLLAHEDLDNLQQVYRRTGWRESAAWRMQILAGDNQIVAPGSDLPIAPKVKVTDQNGNPVEGAVVMFSAQDGSIALGIAQSTDASGVASVGRWRVGTTAGSYALAADINLRVWPNLPPQVEYDRAHVQFKATARPQPVLTSLAASWVYSCAIASDGKAYCWGGNGFGNLGDGTTTDRIAPTLVSGGRIFKSLTSKLNHTCGLTTSGDAYCWGSNSSGGLGNGSLTNQQAPTLVSGGRPYSALAAGTYFTCGLAITGTAYCWGQGDLGQIGDGFTTNRTVPTIVSGGRVFASLAAGQTHACGLTTAGAAYCWGYGFSGQLGNGTTATQSSPTLVSGGLTFSSLVAGGYNTCGLTSAGSAFCWGEGLHGELGNGTTSNRTTPTAVAGGLTFTVLAAGWYHTCGVTTVGTTYCWGDNQYGQLGNSSVTSRTTPTIVAGGLAFSALAAGMGHTCGLAYDGNAYCWGWGAFSQLGNGSQANQLTPKAVRW